MPSDVSNAEWVRFERDRAREKLMPIKVDMAIVRNALEALDPTNRKEPQNDKSRNAKKKK
ncbi:hypothetical protein FPSE_11450 [Fusarium pseudograminearum CS3096]|uniref:Uncharacterized protein n=1 Tax=Fusarium pseudograminearum (strain CS3096) TaxID=1028729 RepID=K3V5H1_FUSPC|nr:hypothetical protein FPSE_11450 [Fusarium pseudograminearum CS3096]EKJ68442.1 hypothetical protein FPSE_11450 [Fusarium pseudograminearum CS3096]